MIDFEPTLLERFQKLTTHVTPDVRDAMHYALFSARDRLCTSTAWVVAPRLGVSHEQFAAAACALETLNCSLSFKLQHPGDDRKYVEPPVAEAAAYGLVPLAFEMLLETRPELGLILARRGSPVQLLSALHRESKIAADGLRHSMTSRELQKLQSENVPPVFPCTGEVLARLSNIPGIADWFARFGLFAFWVDEFATTRSRSPLALHQLMSTPEAIDLIKSLEAELLERARELGLREAAHEIIEPIADVLKTQLQ